MSIENCFRLVFIGFLSLLTACNNQNHCSQVGDNRRVSNLPKEEYRMGAGVFTHNHEINFKITHLCENVDFSEYKVYIYVKTELVYSGNWIREIKFNPPKYNSQASGFIIYISHKKTAKSYQWSSDKEVYDFTKPKILDIKLFPKIKDGYRSSVIIR